jgi:DNA-binding transcriptional MocR family regulator
VAAVPPLRVQRAAELPPGVRDLASGNPDERLLPSLADALGRLDASHKLYGGEAKLPELVSFARADFDRDRIGGEIAITAGALDAVERLLQTELRPGDAVVLEDPSWPRIGDLVHALGLLVEPVPVDSRGLEPEGLADALRRGARAVISTPRGQNPIGAAVDSERAHELREVLAGHPDVLAIEDDYVAWVSGAPYVAVHAPKSRWAVVRSLSKVLGPDLRIALVAGDPLTVARIEGRQRLGPGWVSHLLQRLAAEVLLDKRTAPRLAEAERMYATRRGALMRALAERGIDSSGDSGIGVWIPLPDEAAVVRELLVQGWAVSPGERYRFRSAPGIRVTTAALEPDEAEALGDALAALRAPPAGTYAG